jgi:uncharacterized OB-fold protein
MNPSKETAYLPAELAQLNPNAWTAPFWAAAAEGRLRIPRCPSCEAIRMPPGPCCWRCHGTALDWKEVPGTGRVHTFTVTRRAFHRALAGCVPYVLAVIELDDADGARVISNVVDIYPNDVRVELRVEVVWDRAGEAVIPRFRPCGDRGESGPDTEDYNSGISRLESHDVIRNESYFGVRGRGGQGDRDVIA